MISLAEIRKGIKNPRAGFFELFRRFDRNVLGNRPISILEEDWDSLIILDGCRFDLFEEANTFDVAVEEVTSPATYTRGFLEATFDNGDFPSTVLVSANPNSEFIGARFHSRIPLWDDEWDDELGVTPPQAVTDAALAANNQYPEKRIVVHYMQPHYPFIGEIGRDLTEQEILHYQHAHGDDFWRQLTDENVDKELVWDAYKENLELALPHVEDLVRELSGKSIVTSDHGNEFGRFGVYGHPDWAYTPGLVRVPWAVFENGDRRTITEGTATAGPASEQSTVKDRLAMLGYAED